MVGTRLQLGFSNGRGMHLHLPAQFETNRGLVEDDGRSGHILSATRCKLPSRIVADTLWVVFEIALTKLEALPSSAGRVGCHVINHFVAACVLFCMAEIQLYPRMT